MLLNKVLIWSVLSSLLSLIAIIFFLQVNILRRKTVEESLKVSEERFRLAFEKAHEGICLVGTSSELLKVNQRVCEIFGYSSLELESMTVNDIAHSTDKEASPTFIKKVFPVKSTALYLKKDTFIRMETLYMGGFPVH